MFWLILIVLFLIPVTVVAPVIVYRRLSPFNRVRRMRGFLNDGSGRRYDFVTFDSRNWYEVKEKDGEVVLLGPPGRNPETQAIFDVLVQDIEIPGTPAFST